MKRITLWFMSTISALVLLFGYRTSLAGTTQTHTVASTPKPITTSGSGGSGGTGATSSGSSSTSASSSAKASAGAQASASATSATAKTITGSAIDTRWGPVQVQVTVKGGKITDVSVVQYPSGNGRDVEINNYALPILIQETLDKQSASIDMVSGATYTSDGYVQSLQSALDQAGI